MNIEQMTLTELKSLGYDLIAQGEQIKHNLNLVNQMIAKKSQEQQEVKEPIDLGSTKSEG